MLLRTQVCSVISLILVSTAYSSSSGASHHPCKDGFFFDINYQQCLDCRKICNNDSAEMDLQICELARKEAKCLRYAYPCDGDSVYEPNQQQCFDCKKICQPGNAEMDLPMCETAQKESRCLGSYPRDVNFWTTSRGAFIGIGLVGTVLGVITAVVLRLRQQRRARHMKRLAEEGEVGETTDAVMESGQTETGLLGAAVIVPINEDEVAIVTDSQ